MHFIRRFADRLRALRGWRAYAAAFGLGVCFTLAFPPFWLLPLAVLAFSGWFWMGMAADSTKQAFKLGWWFGFGYHTTGLYWICIALGIDGGAFIWMMPFALCVLPAYLALYTGAVSALAHRFRRGAVEQVVWFALLWLVAEWVRAHLFYGFPWNLAGYVWTISDATLQPASALGVYGMSLWAVLFCTAFALLAVPEAARAQARRGFAVIMAVSVGLAAWGQWRLWQADAMQVEPTEVNLRLVQANVEQSLKWDPMYQRQALQRHINMSTRESADGRKPDYIIWPETAMPYRIAPDSEWTHMLAAIAPRDGAIITGTVRSEGQGDDWQVWNSLMAVNAAGEIIFRYDKSVLVPFGEFVPLRETLSFLPIEKVTQGARDFSPGHGAEVAGLRGMAPPFQPLICYEAIFSEFRPAEEESRTGWLLNITNDAWFGTSTGPYQHLHMARTRAVERGMPLVRVANTGMSAVFDAFGRAKALSGLNEESVIDVALPPQLRVSSWYSRHGEFTLIIICYILLIYAFRPRRKSA